MQQPSNQPDTTFEQLLQDLPDEILQMAIESKAFSRARKIKNPLQLLRAVLLYCGMDKSLREVAGVLTLLYEAITDSSVAERLSNCLGWLKAILPRMLPLEGGVPSGLRFVVIDGSCIQGAGAKGVQYRIHICMNLVSLEFIHIGITDKHTGESLNNFPLRPGDVAVTDRGYCHADALLGCLQAGVELIVRLNPHNLVLRHPNGEKLELSEALKAQPPATVHTLPVLIASTRTGDTAQGWVHAYRLPEAQAEAARRQCRKRNQKKGRTPKKETLFLAGWVIVFSSLAPSAGLSGQTVMALYRARWQVELAIKRWKSLLDVGKLRAKEGSVLAEVWLYGKLLYALLIERRMRRQMGDGWVRLEQERKLSLWRPYKLIKEQLTPLITGVMYWKQRWRECLQVLGERPRARKLQQLPTDATALLHAPVDLFSRHRMLYLAA